MQRTLQVYPEDRDRLLFSVLDLNNKAARRIQQNDFAAGTNELTVALKMMQPLMHGLRAREEGCVGKDQNQNQTILGFLLNTTAPFVDATNGGLQDRRRLVFQLPMSICSAKNLSHNSTTYETMSCALLYNLALCWHLSGLSTLDCDAEQDEKLRKAQKLYIHAKEIMTRCNVQVNPFHYMAVVGNLGQAYLRLGNFTKCDECQKLLLSAIMWFVDGKPKNLQRQKSWLDGFISNVTPQLSSVVSAPAA